MTIKWKCMECGKNLTLKQAQRATSAGCPKCGGTDIDVASGPLANAVAAHKQGRA